MKTLSTLSSFSALALIACTLDLTCGGASAAITGVTGQAINLGSPPISCAVGALSGFNAFAWDEQQSRPLGSLTVDMVNNPGISTAPIGGTLSGIFDSHYIHYEGIPGVINAIGTVSFSQPIAGVIFYNSSLDSTDALLGSFGTTYPTFFPFRDVTTNSSVFSINSNVLSFNLSTISPVGGVVGIRVLTHTVPAPGAAAVAGLAGLAMMRRRRGSADC